MKIAVDQNGQRIQAKGYQPGTKVFCPVCSQSVKYKSGPIRQSYFSHLPGQDCIDHWRYEEMSEWHLAWQDLFPADAQEVVFDSNGEKHRADVAFEQVVIEFQHSSLSPEEFTERNVFYAKMGKRVIWLFDAIEDQQKSRFTFWRGSTPDHFYWSYLPDTLIPFLRKEDSIPFVFIQVRDNPCEIYWIKPELDIGKQRHGFALLSKLTREAFLSFVRLLSSFPDSSSQEFQEGDVLLSVDFDGWNSKIGFSLCHLSPDGFSSIQECECCLFRKRMYNRRKICCGIAKIMGEEIVGNQPRTLFSFRGETISDRFAFYSEEMGLLVSFWNFLPYNKQLYGPCWRENGDGTFQYLGFGLIKYAQLEVWHRVPKDAFPEIDFSEGV